MDLLKTLLRGDKVIWAIFFLLCGISIIELYSASSLIAHKSSNYISPMTSHFTHLLIGFGVLLITSNIKPNYFKVLSVLLGPLSLILLIWLMVFGEKVNDAARAINFMGLQVQPSEMAKLSVIIYVAFILANTQREKGPSITTFKIIISVVGVFCVFILPENFSTAALLGLVCFFMMFIGRIHWKPLVGVLLAGSLFCIAIYFTAPHLPDNRLTHRFKTWRERIDKPSLDLKPLKNAFEIPDDDLQVVHAKMAIANGAFKPTFPGNGIEREFLPLAFSDFIFSIILEETGIFGGLFVMALYLLLLARASIIANRCNNAYPAMLIFGSALMITTQALVNMAVAVNLIPVTGQPLPLISKGGSSIITTCIFIGIMLSVSRFAINEDELNNELKKNEKA